MSHTLALFAVLAPCNASGGEQGKDAINRFVRLVHAAYPMQTGFVLDVGANNGQWARHVLERVREYGKRMRVEPILFEPQREYASSLRQLAFDWDGKFYPAAAWTRATNLSFYLSNFKEASSLLEQIALTFSKPGIGEQRVLRDSDDILNDLEVLLHDCSGAHCVWVSQLATRSV